MVAGIQDFLCGKRFTHGIAAQDLGLIKIINFLDWCPFGKFRDCPRTGAIDQFFHAGSTQAQVNDILCASYIHIDDLLVEVRTGCDDAGDVKNDSLPSFGNIKKRFQALRIRKVAFYNLRFLRDKNFGRVIGQNKYPHFVSLLNQLAAYGAAKEACSSGNQIKNIFVFFI